MPATVSPTSYPLRSTAWMIDAARLTARSSSAFSADAVKFITTRSFGVLTRLRSMQISSSSAALRFQAMCRMLSPTRYSRMPK